MSDIRPGLRIEFFFYSDYEEENVHVMRSLIYDVTGKELIIAQSLPNALRSNSKKKIIVTYLVKQEGTPSRFGFNAKLVDLVHDYRISSGERVPAIILEQEGPPKPFNIRFHFRLRVPSSSDLRLMIRGESATLIDISIGGAMISGAAVRGLSQHGHIGIAVRAEGQIFRFEAEVLRIWSPSAGRHSDLQLAALRFLNAPRLFEDTLGRAIFALERQWLANSKTRSYR